MKKPSVLILLLLLALSQVMFAQQKETFSVASFDEIPLAIDPRYKLVDGNGNQFAIVKVVSNEVNDNLEAYSFDFGLCEHREGALSPDGERWIYVQCNATRVTIVREGFAAVWYELEQTVQPGKVYEMVLAPTHRVVKKRELLFHVTPADSKALILFKAEGEADYRTFKDGVVNAEGMLSDMLVPGRYFYKITSQHYNASDGVIELLDEDSIYTENVTLHPNFGTVTLIAVEGAEIFVDGESKGFGSWTGNYYPGFYNVECRKQNHESTVETIEVKKGETISVVLKVPQPIAGVFAVEPESQQVAEADDEESVNTPVKIKELMTGSRVQEILKKGYDIKTQILDVEERDTANIVSDTLRQVTEMLDVDQELLQVAETDDEESVNTPVKIKELMTSSRVQEILKKGYDIKTQIVDVEKCDTTNIVLQESQPVTETTAVEPEPQLDIEIDDEESEKASIEIKELMADYRVLEILKKGYESKQQTVDIKDGESTGQSVTVENKEPVAEPVENKENDIATGNGLSNDYVELTGNVEHFVKKNYSARRKISSNYYVELSGNVGHLMEIGLNVGAYFSLFNIEAYGNYGLQKGEFYTLYNTHTVMPVSFGGRVGVGIPVGKSFFFTPQFGAGALMVLGEDTRALATTLSCGVRCEWKCLGKFGFSVTPEYVWAQKSDVMQKLTGVCSIAARWCSGFGARIGVFFKF